MRRLLVLASALLVAAVFVPSASASCGYTGTALFAPWGDTALYAPVQGSSFESGSSGWSWVPKAMVVAGDSSPLLGIAGSHAAEIQGGGSAKTPWICVDETTPSLRFFVRRVSGNGNLTVTGTLSGSKVVTTMATITGSGSWQPSPSVQFPASFMTGTLQAQFLFSSDAGSTYHIDDVYIDPWHCC
jgi:hypothetical protein